MASRFRIWALPALFAAGQLAAWPGTALVARRGDLDLRDLAVAIAVTAVVAGAMGGRFRFPVPAVLVVTLASGLGALALPDQVFFVPGDALFVRGVRGRGIVRGG